MTASETRAARRSPTMRSSASTGGRHFLTISLDTAGQRRRVWRAGISKTIVSQSSAIVFLLIMRIEIQWNSLFPLSMPYVTTLQYREIFRQNGSLLYGSDTAKQEFFMRLQLRLQSLHKHDFISYQLLFYCRLTQQHFNFSVSFSFNITLNMKTSSSILTVLMSGKYEQ